MACSSTLDQAAIHWSRNCFHWAMRSGEGCPCVITLDQACMPWSMKGRQKACGSGDCPCPAILSQARVPSSTCFFQRSKSCWAPVWSAIGLSSYDLASSQEATLGQQCTDAPRPAMREMWPPGSSTYSVSELLTAWRSGRTQSGGAMLSSLAPTAGTGQRIISSRAGPQCADVLAGGKEAGDQPEAEGPVLGKVDGPRHVYVVLHRELGRAAQP